MLVILMKKEVKMWGTEAQRILLTYLKEHTASEYRPRN